ncbi:MAG: c-type cytochrome [Alphaproteobacteria bacterium]|nr:c-type cytochrome [Alphaproteobacteria bacterium]
MAWRWISLVAALAWCLAAAAGTRADPRLGLPPAPLPADDRPNAACVELGRKLFFDRRLSFNGTMSCAMCHVPEQGFTANELATPLGVEGRSLRRNAPTLLNVAYSRRLFHDGRDGTLEHQAWSPLLAASEMANPSIGFVLDRIAGLSDYDSWFAAAFAGRGPAMDTVARALAAYQRTLIAGGSRFDRWRYGGDGTALTAEERRGHGLFVGAAGCHRCHTVDDRSALFTDHGFHNTGIGAARAARAARPVRVELVPGLTTEVDRRALATFAEPVPVDLGRFEITQNPADRWAYRTPTLRNVALTAPYMHDGSIATLEAVIDYYDGGGFPDPAKSALVRPLGLSAEERRAVAAFLRALTGDAVADLVMRARAPFSDVPPAR